MPDGEDQARPISRLRKQVSPELLPMLDFYVSHVGTHFIASFDAEERRRKFAAFMALAAPSEPACPDVRRVDHLCPSREAGRSIPVRSYHPGQRSGLRGGLLLMHGGGFTLGSVSDEDALAASLASLLGSPVVSIDYRLAPEHPGLAPVEDCFDALVWAAAHAGALGFAPDRLALYGQSAGGGLAAGLALLARDRGGPSLTGQVLCYPMLDDRNDQPSRRENDGLGAWDAASNTAAWRELLGAAAGDPCAAVPAYAAPARADDLEGLPPAFIDVGTLDVLLDDAVNYARRLMASGVPAELHVYPGAYHGFDLFGPEAEVSRKAVAARLSAVRTFIT